MVNKKNKYDTGINALLPDDHPHKRKPGLKEALTIAAEKKPGRPKGTGYKPGQFNMRCDEQFTNQLRFIKQNKNSVYFGFSISTILEQMVSDHVTLMNMCHPGIESYDHFREY